MTIVLLLTILYFIIVCVCRCRAKTFYWRMMMNKSFFGTIFFSNSRFSTWPRDALVAVSKHFLEHFQIECTPSVKTQLIECLGSVHDALSKICGEYFQRFRRATHVTPKSFLSFVDIYKTVYRTKVAVFVDLADRMKLGLEKLIEAGESVEKLSKELVFKERDLAAASARAEKVWITVTNFASALWNQDFGGFLRGNRLICEPQTISECIDKKSTRSHVNVREYLFPVEIDE